MHALLPGLWIVQISFHRLCERQMSMSTLLGHPFASCTVPCITFKYQGLPQKQIGPGDGLIASSFLVELMQRNKRIMLRWF